MSNRIRSRQTSTILPFSLFSLFFMSSFSFCWLLFCALLVYSLYRFPSFSACLVLFPAWRAPRELQPRAPSAADQPAAPAAAPPLRSGPAKSRKCQKRSKHKKERRTLIEKAMKMENAAGAHFCCAGMAMECPCRNVHLQPDPRQQKLQAQALSQSMQDL